MERAVWLDYLEGLGIIEYIESLERLENLQLRPWRLSALALVSHQFFLQLFYTFFQLFYLVGLRLNCFVLGLSAAQSGSRHAFFYAALLLFCGLLVMLTCLTSFNLLTLCIAQASLPLLSLNRKFQHLSAVELNSL